MPHWESGFLRRGAALFSSSKMKSQPHDPTAWPALTCGDHFGRNCTALGLEVDQQLKQEADCQELQGALSHYIPGLSENCFYP